VARWARTSLSRFQNRPWLLETARRRVPIGPNWLGWLDAGAAMLESLTSIRRAGADAILTYAAVEAAQRLG